MENADWEDIAPRALLWAASYHRQNLAPFRNSPTPNDLFQEAVASLFIGTRVLPEGEAIIAVIIKVMHSEASKFISSQVLREKHRESILKSGNTQSSGDEYTSGMELKYILSLLKDDEVSCEIVSMLWEDPGQRARHLAEALKLTIDEVYNALKRMRRKLDEYAKSNYNL